MKYYAAVANVGDLLNPYMVTRITGHGVWRLRTHRFDHLFAIGSMVEWAGPRSWLWGTGSIDGSGPGRAINPARVTALRGHSTLELLAGRFGVDATIPLGDPAVLMPRFFRPPPGPCHGIGIVAHHSEVELLRSWMEVADPGIRLIDVRQQPEPFIAQLVTCERVISSSLHGLILADAYGIPNRWAVFSDRLLGGTWKFRDYYSVTATPERRPEQIGDGAALRAALVAPDARWRVSAYAGDGDRLLGAFPACFGRREGWR